MSRRIDGGGADVATVDRSIVAIITRALFRAGGGCRSGADGRQGQEAA